MKDVTIDNHKIHSSFCKLINKLNSLGEKETYPNLTVNTGSLSFSEQCLSAQQLTEIIPDTTDCGWFMYTDTFSYEPRTTVANLLEAEWRVGDNSFHARHLGNNEYYVTNYISSGDTTALYRDVTVEGRKSGTCTYRVWWTHSAEGLIKALGQQLIKMESI